MNLFDKSGKKILAVVIVLIIVILGSWILLKSDSEKNLEQVTLGPEDNGKTFQVTDETEIFVELPENPSTGYRWKIAEGKNSMNLLENEYINSENVPGGGGLRKLKFKITKSGKFVMHYIRPWENQIENKFVVRFQL